MERQRRPGYLTKYAAHAGISKTAASEQLSRVGIDYKQPFDFADADRKRAAMRSADRAPFAKPIYEDVGNSESAASEPVSAAGGDSQKDPVFAESQRRREFYKAELARLEFEERSGRLIDREQAEAVVFEMFRKVRNILENIASRVSGPLSTESDQRKVYEVLAAEHRQACEVLSSDGETSDVLASV